MKLVHLKEKPWQTHRILKSIKYKIEFLHDKRNSNLKTKTTYFKYRNKLKHCICS